MLTLLLHSQVACRVRRVALRHEHVAISSDETSSYSLDVESVRQGDVLVLECSTPADESVHLSLAFSQQLTRWSGWLMDDDSSCAVALCLSPTTCCCSPSRSGLGESSGAGVASHIEREDGRLVLRAHACVDARRRITEAGAQALASLASHISASLITSASSSAQASTSASTSTRPGPAPRVMVYLTLLNAQQSWRLYERALAHVYALVSHSLVRALGRPDPDVVVLPTSPSSLSPPAHTLELGVVTEQDTRAESGQEEGDGRDSANVTALGGTFDHLHVGHKILLSMAAFITSQRLIIGITDDGMLKNKAHRDEIEPLDDRLESVRAFVKLIKPGLPCIDAVSISDPYGPTATDASCEALVVSSETRSGAEAVNKKRRENGLAPLHVCVVDVLAENKGGDDDEAPKMSSTAIREWLSTQHQPHR